MNPSEPSTPAAPMPSIQDEVGKLRTRLTSAFVALAILLPLAGGLGLGLQQELKHTRSLQVDNARLQNLAIASQRARMQCEWRGP